VATTTSLDNVALQQFGAALCGPLLEQGDGGYDAARGVWNAMVDRWPALIARCHGAADVTASTNFARQQGLPVSVRGGGHNASGNAVCDAGSMIDLWPMKSIRVDLRTMTVRAGPGVLWGEFDRETRPSAWRPPQASSPKAGPAQRVAQQGEMP
jgi:FAD/FMN-containing dehydrogenase